MPKTTKANFKTFTKEADYWIDKFQLREWRVYFVHDRADDLPDALAWRGANFKGRVATIGLSPDWQENEITDWDLCLSAFHEVCELMTADIVSVASLDICPSDSEDLEAYIHSLIRRLEHAVWLPDYKRRKK